MINSKCVKRFLEKAQINSFHVIIINLNLNPIKKGMKKDKTILMNVLSFSFHDTYLIYKIIISCFYTFSKNVSGCPGSKTSLHVITVTKSSVSDRLMML